MADIDVNSPTFNREVFFVEVNRKPERCRDVCNLTLYLALNHFLSSPNFQSMIGLECPELRNNFFLKKKQKG